MLSREIEKTLKTISEKSGIKAKSAYLELHINDPELQEVLRFALSPYITFGVGTKTLEKCMAATKQQAHSGGFTTDTWELLERLANRHLTGSAAEEEITEELESLDEPSCSLLLRILCKDLNIGLKATSINKIKKGLIPQYKVALAHPLKKYEGKMPYPAACELKLDGMRVLSHVTLGDNYGEGTAEFKSREGIAQQYDNLESVVIDLAWEIYANMPEEERVESFIVDGELESGVSFKTSMSALKKGGGKAEGLRYTVFWAQPLEMFLKQETFAPTYKQHRPFLKKVFKNNNFISETETKELLAEVKLVDSYIVNSKEEAMSIYQAARDKGLEGVIVKNIDAQYDYKRTNTWLKVKACETLDLTIVDVEEGEGRLANSLGKLIVEYKGVRVKVGSGLTDEVREAVWDDPDSYIEEVIEVSYQEVTEAGSLRHPVFEGFRSDKTSGASTDEDKEIDEKKSVA